MKFFTCPFCNQKYDYNVEYLGKKIKCAECNKIFECNHKVDDSFLHSRTIRITTHEQITKNIILHVLEYQKFKNDLTNEQFSYILELSPKIDIETVKSLDKRQAKFIIEQLEEAHKKFKGNAIEGIFIKNIELVKKNTESKEIPNDESPESFFDYIKKVKYELSLIEKVSELFEIMPYNLIESDILSEKLKSKLEYSITEFNNNCWVEICDIYKNTLKRTTDKMDILFERFCDCDWKINQKNITMPTIKQFYDICFYLDKIYGKEWDKTTNFENSHNLIKETIKKIFPELIK